MEGEARPVQCGDRRALLTGTWSIFGSLTLRSLRASSRSRMRARRCISGARFCRTSRRRSIACMSVSCELSVHRCRSLRPLALSMVLAEAPPPRCFPRSGFLLPPAPAPGESAPPSVYSPRARARTSAMARARAALAAARLCCSNPVLLFSSSCSTAASRSDSSCCRRLAGSSGRGSSYVRWMRNGNRVIHRRPNPVKWRSHASLAHFGL